ncbi:MAG: EAL domain-containing protein [Sulfuricurvum sp.]|uniref:GGDEF and EAL domain-containing protein n=1 Tax=Sulfuricurvum sp. TaxID=2025608 RepID=UPI002636B877|nr:GGDEF and EAL domain-containing protein [Sulfuricurvum sp.]MDD2367905.1 EAL domain-containing protein [Sulfuricurvum sp.]MDD5118043.1 EAL domain-containing protein [Sulfuricurvum sp.]
MPKHLSPANDAQVLRHKAEEIVRGNELLTTNTLSPEEISRVLHELQVHQIELEMQNDELRKIQSELDAEREDYFDLYNLAPIGYCTLNEEGEILQANRAASSLLGADQDKLIHHQITDFIFGEDQDIYYFFRKHFFKPCELRLMKENQTCCWVQLSANRLEKAQRNNTICLILNDITERKEAEEERRIAAIAFESQAGMVITDAQGVILRINPAFTRLTNYDQKEIVGQTMRVLKSGRHDKLFYQQMWKTLKESKRWQGEIWNKRKNGQIYAELLTITAVTDANEKITHYIGNFSDITKDKEAEAVIHRLAYYDPLTKLPNRRLFQERLNQAIISTERSQLFGAIFFLDLDNFKGLNDTRGHDAGDLLLIEVAERLRTMIREGDTVARQGGDEFIILLQNLKTDIQETAYLAKQIGDKLLTEMNDPFLLKDFEYYCKLSIGIELFNKDNTAEDIFKHADIAMYQAKKSGGNQLLFFDPKMQHALDLRSTMEYELKQALESNQFRLYYQPQIDNLQRVTGVEALIRWEHPQRGLILPDEFIPLSEETGFIIPMGQWVLQSACAQLKAWEADEHTRHLRISVNVSARQFRQKDFVTLLEKTLEMSGANPELLKLELTESLVLENVQDTIEKMDAINRLGVHFSMDDFGTGYSSLSYLAKLPLNQIKIDRSFVRNLPENKNDAMIVRTIITMGIGLEMNVIAEGIETLEQFEFLEAHGCHAYQGYLFGHPLDIDTLSIYLLDNWKRQQKGVRP